jgi:hypothetical protein
VEAKPPHAVIIVATPDKVKVRRVLRNYPHSKILWAAAVPSVADGEAVAGRGLIRGHLLDGRPITRALSDLSALLEARARALDVQVLGRYSALDEDED